MNTVDWLREFKMRVFRLTDAKTGWGKNELRAEIERAYQETLEEMINSNTDMTRSLTREGDL